MISTRLKQKIAVLCKDYYVNRTIDDLFIFSGCEKEWWSPPQKEHGSDRMNNVFGWFEGISKNIPEKEIEILKAICENLIMNDEIPAGDKKQIELFLERNNIVIQADILERYNFHPKVKEIADPLFKNGHFRQAILDVYIALVDAVKKKSECHNLDNSPLMQRAFSQNNPILKVSEDKDEQLGFMWLFSGAVMAIRNPKAHRLIEQTDSDRTLEWLAFASVLFRVLDESKKQ
jgi:uncharacterized protein (TIGR02391 family)